MIDTRKTVAVDLDGTLAQYTKWEGIDSIGEPITGAREFLQSLHEGGYKILIWTTRLNPALNGRDGWTADDLKANVEGWLKKHNMPYDEVYTGPVKPIAYAFIDDRAIPCEAMQFGTLAYSFALELLGELH